MLKEVFVVAVCRNEEQYIENFILSIRHSTFPVKTVIVDNASNDKTVELAEKYLDEIILLRQKDNAGFGIGNNIGIKYALEHNADYLFLLNVDMTISPDTIQKLLDTATKHPEFGIISPVCMNFSGKKFENMFYDSLVRKNNIYKDVRLFFSELYNKTTHSLDIYETSFINAAHWFMPASAIKKTGGFDPVFFPIYNEDDEWCVRIQEHGFKIGFIPETRVYHDTEDRSPSKLPPVHFVLVRDYSQIIHSPSFSIFYRLIALAILRIAKNILKLQKENLQFNFNYLREMMRRKSYLKKIRKLNQQKTGIGICTHIPSVCKPGYLGR